MRVRESDFRVTATKTLLAEDRAAKVAEIKRLQQANEDTIQRARVDGENVDVPADMADTIRGNIATIKTLRADVEMLDGVKEGRDWLDAPAAASIATAAQAAAHKASSDPYGGKSLGQLFVESEEFKALDAGRRSATMSAPFRVNVADIGRYAGGVPLGRKDFYSAMPDGDASFGTVQRDPMLLLPQRSQRVRDLFPAQQTNAAAIDYFRQTGFVNNASVVPEREGSTYGRKPQSGTTFDKVMARVSTIAHWDTAHRNVLADEPQLRGIIDSTLLYGLRLHEDWQILLGTGTGEDLPGILNEAARQRLTQAKVTAGTGFYAGNRAGDNKADALRRAMTLGFLAMYEATGIVVYATDWEEIELLREDDAGQTGQYLKANINTGGTPRVWNLPVVTVPFPELSGRALVGAFGLAAQLYDREDATIRVSENVDDQFVRNAVTILAEERLMLVNRRPEAFVDVAFA